MVRSGLVAGQASNCRRNRDRDLSEQLSKDEWIQGR